MQKFKLTQTFHFNEFMRSSDGTFSFWAKNNIIETFGKRLNSLFSSLLGVEKETNYDYDKAFENLKDFKASGDLTQTFNYTIVLNNEQTFDKYITVVSFTVEDSNGDIFYLMKDKKETKLMVFDTVKSNEGNPCYQTEAVYERDDLLDDIYNLDYDIPLEPDVIAKFLNMRTEVYKSIIAAECDFYNNSTLKCIRDKLKELAKRFADGEKPSIVKGAPKEIKAKPKPEVSQLESEKMLIANKLTTLFKGLKQLEVTKLSNGIFNGEYNLYSISKGDYDDVSLSTLKKALDYVSCYVRDKKYEEALTASKKPKANKFDEDDLKTACELINSILRQIGDYHNYEFAAFLKCRKDQVGDIRSLRVEKLNLDILTRIHYQAKAWLRAKRNNDAQYELLKSKGLISE